MSQLSPGLLNKIQANPEAQQNVIVRVDGDMDVYEQQLQSQGFQIRRKLRLIKGFAVTAPGSRLQQLSSEPWVSSIEEDQQVQTM